VQFFVRVANATTALDADEKQKHIGQRWPDVSHRVEANVGQSSQRCLSRSPELADPGQRNRTSVCAYD
jgi:hypothetical protein